MTHSFWTKGVNCDLVTVRGTLKEAKASNIAIPTHEMVKAIKRFSTKENITNEDRLVFSSNDIDVVVFENQLLYYAEFGIIDKLLVYQLSLTAGINCYTMYFHYLNATQNVNLRELCRQEKTQKDSVIPVKTQFFSR